MRRVVVAVDPSGIANDTEGGDDIGIVVGGLGTDDQGYILADKTVRCGPKEWGEVAVQAYKSYQADRNIAESNFGGAMVENVIRSVDKNVPYRAVRY